MKFYYDKMRHLICIPYSVQNLHAMALSLSIKRHWFHKGYRAHYDIPKRKMPYIHLFATRISARTLLLMTKGETMMIKDLDKTLKKLRKEGHPDVDELERFTKFLRLLSEHFGPRATREEQEIVYQEVYGRKKP